MKKLALLVLVLFLGKGWAQEITSYWAYLGLNSVRSMYGLGPLQVDDELANAARIYLDAIIGAGVETHDLIPYEDKVAMTRAFTSRDWRGECLCLMYPDNFDTAVLGARLIRNWYNSKPHLALLVDAQITHMGIVMIRKGAVIWAILWVSR